MINATLALLAESVVPTLMLESPLPFTSGVNRCPRTTSCRALLTPPTHSGWACSSPARDPVLMHCCDINRLRANQEVAPT